MDTGARNQLKKNQYQSFTDAVIVATGGVILSGHQLYREMVMILKRMQNTSYRAVSALVPFEPSRMMYVTFEVSLRNIEAVITMGGRTLQGFGEMLSTHFRVSGPVLLSASR